MKQLQKDLAATQHPQETSSWLDPLVQRQWLWWEKVKGQGLGPGERADKDGSAFEVPAERTCGPEVVGPGSLPGSSCPHVCQALRALGPLLPF